MEAVIFDLGNVLLTLESERALDAVASRTGKSRAELERYITTTPWTRQLALGGISQWDFYETVATELGFTGSYDDFANAWSDMFRPNEPILDVARRLKGRVPRVILSNTNAIHIRYIFAHFPCVRGFDGYVFSHEVGVEKPDPRIYGWTVQRYRLNPARTVFIDDFEPNVEGARAVGLHAIHYQTSEQTRQELTKLGVPHI